MILHASLEISILLIMKDAQPVSTKIILNVLIVQEFQILWIIKA